MSEPTGRELVEAIYASKDTEIARLTAEKSRVIETVAVLGGKLAKAEAENAALRATMERLSAPVSDEELMARVPEQTGLRQWAANKRRDLRFDFDAIIAARRGEGL